MATKIKRSRDAGYARTRLLDIFHALRISQAPSAEFTKQEMELRTKFNLPSYEWSYLRGYADALRHEWQMQHIYCVEWRGKIIPMDWDKIPEELRQHCRDSKPYTSGHYWKNQDGSPGRPYFVSAVNEKE